MISRYLDLSTAHVTQKDMDLISFDYDNNPVYSYDYEYGSFVFLPDTKSKIEQIELFCDLIEYGYSKSFVKVVKYAKDLDCTMIRLDCDGDTYVSKLLDTNNW